MVPEVQSGRMRLRDALRLSSLANAAVVAGQGGLERDVRWAHVVDMPDPAPWIGPGQLLLTTGYAWPLDPEAERSQLEALAKRELAGIGLAVPTYRERFSANAREHAERLALPLLEIPWDVPFARITEELHRELLSVQQRTIERSEQIHRALTRAASEGTTLNDLARRLGALIDRSITIEDTHGNVLGFHAIPSHEDPVRRETIARTRSPRRTTLELERRGTYERIRRSAAPVRIAAMPDLELDARLVCPIRVGGEIAGYVWIIEGEAALSDLDHRAAEHGALVAALQIAHQRELAQVESRLGYTSFLSLLEAPAATPQMLERAQLLGFDPAVTYRAGIAVLDEPLPLAREAVLRRDALIERLRRHLAALGVERPMLGAALDRIPFLLPAEFPIADFAPELATERLRFVFGRPAAGTDGARASYQEAQELLAYDGLGRVAAYEEVLVPRVLLGDARARDAFLRDLFAPLEGRKGGPTLREALMRYAEHGFAFRRTANALGIHPNTLRYRLERAAELTGLTLDDPDVRFRLQLASRLVRLRANHSDRTHKDGARS
jgi:purine catabolism regulator